MSKESFTIKEIVIQMDRKLENINTKVNSIEALNSQFHEQLTATMKSVEQVKQEQETLKKKLYKLGGTVTALLVIVQVLLSNLR